MDNLKTSNNLILNKSLNNNVPKSLAPTDWESRDFNKIDVYSSLNEKLLNFAWPVRKEARRRNFNPRLQIGCDIA